MNASEIGSNDWWLVVLSMPSEEALTALQTYKSLLLEATLGDSSYASAAKKITRVNFEIKRINRLMSDNQWREACKQMLPTELYDAISVRVSLGKNGGKM